jgi:hypothetical protein
MVRIWTWKRTPAIWATSQVLSLGSSDFARLP